MICHCPQCSANQLPSYTEAHRRACEIRFLAGLDSDARRAEYLKGAEEHRGAAAAQELRRDVWRAIQEQRQGVPF